MKIYREHYYSTIEMNIISEIKPMRANPTMAQLNNAILSNQHNCFDRQNAYDQLQIGSVW